jgi:hypothetical protein
LASNDRIDHLSERGEVRQADVLEHPDRHERNARAGDVAVVVLENSDAPGEAFTRRPVRA